MALFPLKKISEAAAGRQAYLRGVSLYNSGKVGRFARTAGSFFAEYLTADVDAGEEGVFHAEAGFSQEGEVSHMACGCAAFRDGGGACKHIVAVMVQKYYADMLGGPAGGRPAPSAPRRSDDAARRMMQAYLAGEAAALAAGAAGEADRIALVPVLHAGAPGQAVQEAGLSFRLNGRRSYILKDIARFCADMAVGATAAYGKLLRFVHHPDSFTEESRPLLHFLLQEYADLTARSGAAGCYGAPKIGKTLPLTPGALDRFFALMEGARVAVQDAAGEDTVRFLQDDPVLCVTVDGGDAAHGLTFRTEAVTGIRGVSRLYLLRQDTLCACGAPYTRRMAAWIEAAQRARGGLFVAREDLTAFCSAVLPVIAPCVRLEGDTEQLEPYRPLPLETAVYLDAPDPGTITARVEHRYGGETFNPYDREASGAYRDTLGELKIRVILQKYFTAYVPAEGHLIFHGDDDALFRFVDSGVKEIEQAAAVYATDRFKKIGILPPPRVTAGVRLESGLLELDLDTGGFEPAELGRVLDSYHRRQKYHRLKSGSFIQLEDGALAALAEMADSLGLTEKELRTGRIRLPKYRAMYLDALFRSRKTVVFRRDDAFRALIKNMKSVADNAYALPASLEPVLRGYQKTGFRWLKTMEEAGFGGILADDMGLGKTLQIIALLLDARERGNDRPSLVVCPASLIYNWAAEMHRFAPALTVLPVLGDAGQRADSLRKAAGYDVIVTSYDLLKRDIEQYLPREFRYLILDEAQYIKNHATQNARAVKAIHSRQRFALTGTPVENRLSELWSLFDFLMPGYLYPYSRFRERLEAPIVKEQDAAALARLSAMTAPFILRRLKKDVLAELPPKTESVLLATMEGEQKRLYLANAAQARQEISRELAQGGGDNNRFALLAMLTRLRQICCSPSLCYEDYTGESCKLETCLELLRSAAEAGHKVLLFSQFTSMLSILADRLQAEGLSYFLLQGSTSKEQRAAMADRFNQDGTQVFLISLKAGGTGLNLTGADMVIHYDPWWNLAAQNQATDRAYRIGQKNPVQVVRLIVKDTIEERILALQENKKGLAEAVVREDGPLLSSLTAEQLLDMFS